MQNSTLLERRLANEWQLLTDLSNQNPGRLTGLRLDGSSITLRLHGPEAVTIRSGGRPCPITRHDIRIDFPVHFPAVPMEMFLQVPVFHPNIHPETGFVCLWERHRVSNTVEHALHKLVAMLAGELQNMDPVHVMQSLAGEHTLRGEAMPLLGVQYDPGSVAAGTASLGGRRRLQ